MENVGFSASDSLSKATEMDSRKPLEASTLPNIVRGEWSASNVTTTTAHVKVQREESHSKKNALLSRGNSAQPVVASEPFDVVGTSEKSLRWLKLIGGKLQVVLIAPGSEDVVFVDISNAKCTTRKLDVFYQKKRKALADRDFANLIEGSLERLYNTLPTPKSRLGEVPSASFALQGVNTPTIAPKRAPPRPPGATRSALFTEKAVETNQETNSKSAESNISKEKPSISVDNEPTGTTASTSPNRAIYLRMREMEREQENKKMIKELTEKVSKYEVLLEEKQNSLAKLSGESKGLLDAIRNLKSGKEALKQQMESQQTAAETQAKSKNDKLQITNAQLEETRLKLELAQQELMEANSTIRQVQNKYDDLEQETLEAARVFQSLKQYHKEYKSKSERQLQQVKNGGEEYQALLENEKSRSQQFSKMEQEARGQIEKKTMETLRAKRELEAVQGELEKERDANDVLRRELELRDSVTTGVQAQLQEKERQLRELKADLFDAREALEKRKSCAYCS